MRTMLASVPWFRAASKVWFNASTTSRWRYRGVLGIHIDKVEIPLIRFSEPPDRMPRTNVLIKRPISALCSQKKHVMCP